MTEKSFLLEKSSLLSGATVWESRAIPDLGVRTLIMSDGPHGIRRQEGPSDHLGLNASQPATCFPTAATIANAWDVELVTELGQALAAEAVALGVDVVLGPGLNIKRSPLCGRNFEYLSEDPYLAGKLATGYVNGIQSQGIAACPKHYAANSQETRRMASDSVVDERTLHEIYLAGFEMVVRDGAPKTIMSSYNKVNGTYAHEDPYLLNEVLRKRWGFDGAVISDWGGSNDAVAAAAAGGTLEMPSPGLGSVREVYQAATDGTLSVADLDARVAEMRTLGERIDPSQARPSDHDAHHELARRAAEASVVLLKNDDDILPLSGGTAVAVIGDFAANPRYQGAGSSLVNATRLSTALDAVGGSDLTMVEYAQGFQRNGGADAELAAAAVSVAKSADVVLLYLGLDETSESEGTDRTHMKLPENQVELLAKLREVTDRIVVVLSAGSSVEMPWISQATALVHGYLGGQAGAEAAVNVITGKVNPSGKLAESYPLRLEDNPSHQYYPALGELAQYREGPYVGYRYYSTVDLPVLFPFGFGLSYTTFEYSDLELTDAGAKVTVTNTGERAGSEIVQLYVSRPEGAPAGPVRELKGFAKVSVEPGSSAVAQIRFGAETFRRYSLSQSGWTTDAGTYQIGIGAHVNDIRLSGSIEVDGSSDAAVAEAQVPAPYQSGRVDDVSQADFEALLGRSLPQEAAADAPLELNSPLLAMHHARSPLARLAARMLKRQIEKAEAKGTPDLNSYFLYNMPFRAIAKMTNGAANIPMVEAIVTIVNGRHFRGIKALISAYFANNRDNKQVAAQLADSTDAAETAAQKG
ncbi:MAG: glycoside hydrolase family 3 C-terminal domain-containing protein [Beutenbergiaceae bacterium]